MGCQNGKSRGSDSLAGTRKEGFVVRSQAQLEYEFTNCFEHFSMFQQELSEKLDDISKLLGGRQLTPAQCIDLFHNLEMSNKIIDKQIHSEIEDLLRIVSEGKQLLTLLISQLPKYQTLQAVEKKELAKFRMEIAHHFSFCGAFSQVSPTATTIPASPHLYL